MFEDKSELLRGHIEFFKSFLSEKEDTEFDLQEVEQRLEDSENDIAETRSNLPYDEIDDDDVPVEDFSGDNLEDGELEDEIVEVEGLIDELEDLMDEVRESIDDDHDESNEDTGDTVETSDSQGFYSKLEKWLVDELSAKCVRKNLQLSQEDISRKAKAIILGARCCGRFEQAEDLARENCPEYRFTAEELKQDDLFAPDIFHVSMEMIQTYDILKERFDFEGWLKFKKEIWMKNL